MTRDELLALVGGRLGLEVGQGSARGRKEGREVELHVPATYPSAGAAVELAGHIAPALDLGLGVDRVASGGPARPFPASGPELSSGLHSWIPEQVRVFADEPERARALFTPLAGELGALVRQTHLLAVTDSVVAMVIDGTSARAVELGVQRLLGLLHRIENASEGVPVARALSPFVEDFRTLARSRGLEVQATPLGARGRVGDAEVLVFARRTGVERFGLVLEVRPDEPLGVELTVRPRAPADGAAPAFGVPALDQMFAVEGPPDLVTRAFASPDGQRLLLALAPWAPTLQRSTLTLRAPELPGDLVHVERFLATARALLGRLAEAAMASAGRGPYR